MAAATAFLAVAITTGCRPEADPPQLAGLELVASSEAPLSANTDVALVTKDVACVVDSYNSRIRCADRGGAVVSVFGREGSGPGEFRSPRALDWYEVDGLRLEG